VGEYAVASTRAASYHVQIARDGIFRDITADTKVPSGVQRLEAQVPTGGRYYIRVSAVDDDRFEGPFGPTARTLVIHPTKTRLSNGQRSIEIDPPDAFCVRVGNVALTRIAGHPIVVPVAEPVRVRCAPNDSDPTTLIRLN
jgi:hypothetical protein